MTGRAVKGMILLLVLLVLSASAGCTRPQEGGIPTPAVTPPGRTTPAPLVTVPPGPVVTAPPQYDVAVQVTRNPNTAFPYITFTFRGGNGQFILQEIQATVARSDGKVIQEVIPMSGNGQYAVGDFVEIEGTTGTDEAVVVVTLNGVRYKIYDEFLTFGASQ